jgi:hypothetical protein
LFACYKGTMSAINNENGGPNNSVILDNSSNGCNEKINRRIRRSRHRGDDGGDDDDDDVEYQESTNKKKPKRSTDCYQPTTKTAVDGVFDQSHMTDQERRDLRRKQRELGYQLLHDVRNVAASENVEIISTSSQPRVMSNSTIHPISDVNAADTGGVGNNVRNALQFLSETRLVNNKLFDRVVFTREAVLDADNVHLIANKYVQQVDRLVQVPRYDPAMFVRKLRSQLLMRHPSSPDGLESDEELESTNQVFNWRMLGRESGICFNSIPRRVTFLNGPLQHHVSDSFTSKTRKVAVRRARATDVNEPVVRPEQVADGGTTKDATDKATAMDADKTLKAIKKQLHLSQQNVVESLRNVGIGSTQDLREAVGVGGGDVTVDGWPFLVNPCSFTQTVENIFHYSFLIKNGTAGIGIRPRKETSSTDLGNNANVVEINNERRDAVQQVIPPGLFVHQVTRLNHSVPSKQSILALTMADWRRLCEAYGMHQRQNIDNENNQRDVSTSLDGDNDEEVPASADISNNVHQKFVALPPKAIPHRPVATPTIRLHDK